MQHRIQHRDMANRVGDCAIDGVAVRLTSQGECAIAFRDSYARWLTKTKATPEGRARLVTDTLRYHAKRETSEGRALLHEQYQMDITKSRSKGRRSSQRGLGHKVPELNVREVEILIEMQNGRCLICDKEIDIGTANRDHDHKSREYRGYLDNHCNRAIVGFFDADPKRLSWINAYFEATEKPPLNKQERLIVAFFEKDAERLPRLNDFFAQAEGHIRHEAMVRLQADLSAESNRRRAGDAFPPT